MVKKRHTKQHKLALVVGGVVIIASIVAGAIWYFAMNQDSPTATIVSDISAEETPQRAACQLITTDDIKAAFYGDRIIAIDEGVRTGSAALNDTIAENCVFAFSTEKSRNNTLTVSVYPYTAPNGNESSTDALNASWSEIATSKPMAYFGRAKEDEDKTTAYMVRSIPGANNVLLTLRQPSDAISFDEPDSLNFLVGTVVKVRYDALEEKAQETTESALEGEGPSAPPKDTRKQTLTPQ